MEPKTFLQEVLPNTGTYCIFAANTSADKRQQTFYNSVDELLEAATNLDNQGYDVYFALASFKEKNSRKVNNIQHLKSFFLDLDCGPSKEFTSQGDALHQLIGFCKQASLPKPIVIDSGRGIHAYWPLTEAVPFDDWLPVANKLKQLCADNKFMADPAVTADGARVLRVPKTHNYKPDTPVEVTCVSNNVTPTNFDVFSVRLGNLPIPVPPKRKIAGANAVMQAALGNQEYRFKTILEKSMAGNGCAQILDVIKHPDTTSEPVWRGVLSILKASSDGSREKAHKISSRYSGYTAEETNEKWDNLTADKRYTCSRFEEEKPETCLECPNRGKFRSPLHIGKRIKEATAEDNVVEIPSDTDDQLPAVYTIPTYPFPYVRGATGGVYVRVEQEDGDFDEKKIYHNDIYVTKRIIDIELGESVVMRLHLPKDGVREFTVPLTAVTSRDEFRKRMAMQGVALNKMDDLMHYVTAWVNELQATDMADKAYMQFGWTDDAGESFILGNQRIYKDRVEYNPPSTKTAGLFPAFEPKGTLDEWKKIMDFYNKPGFELHQYVVCTGFGSILMHFLPDIACCALHIYSKDSGLGKTTVMMAASSIYGDPKDLVLYENDTHNTKMNRSELLHNLPLYIDELTNSRPEPLSSLVLQFTSGRQRNRLVSGSNAERYRGDPWSFLSVSSGNVSVIEKIRMFKDNPNAEAQRIMEAHADKLFTGAADKVATDKFGRDLQQCYGHAGPLFIQYVISNIDSVRLLIGEVQRRIDKEARLSSENRFWSAGTAVTIAGAIIANRIGLINYSIKELTKWTLSLLEHNKNRTQEMSVSLEQTLNEYINDHWDNVLRIKSTSDLRKQSGEAMDSIIAPDALPRNKLVARYEPDTGKLFLVPKPFRRWCGEQQINYGAFVSDMVSKLGAKREKARLGKGTPFKLKSQDCIVVKFSEDKDETSGITDL